MIPRLRAIVVRLAGLFGAARREHDWNAEFQAHLEMHIEDNLRAGMTQEEARRRALASFGGVESTKESMRDLSTIVWLDVAWRDLRYALRSLWRSPGFTFAALLSLTLGLGASLAVFTVADNLLVRPLPFRNASELTAIWESYRGGTHNEVAPANYLEWKGQNDVFEGLAGLSPSRSAVLVANGRAEEFLGQAVTADFFPLLGVRPVRGRLFSKQEDRSPGQVTLISYRLWQSWFGRDENIIGHKIELNSLPMTIIGVLPKDFYFLDRQIDFWGPLGLTPAMADWKVSGRWMFSVGRIRPGVTVREAQAHMTALAKRLEHEYPAFNTNWGVNVEPLRDALFREAKTPVLVLLAAVILLLAVGCANVANLLLARYSSRMREIAMRASLGASRWRVIQQLLTESVVLGAAGGIFGLILARWMVAALLALAPKDLAQSTQIQLDLRMVVFAIAISLATGILFGLAPAMVTSRLDLTGALRADSRSGLGAGSRLRSWLIGAEVAVSVVLLTSAILLFRSLIGLQSVDTGLNPSNVLTFRLPMTASRYRQATARTQFLGRTLNEVARIPGVRAASAVSFLPFTGPGAGTWVNIEGRPPAKPGTELEALIRTVMPGYFRTLGIPLKSGRDFADSDLAVHSPYHFIVNEAFVRQYLRGEEPLGKRINAVMEPQNPYGEIVGVVGDVRESAIDRPAQPTVYYPYNQLAYPRMVFVLKVDHDPLSLSGTARRVIQQLDPEQPIAEVRSLEQVLGENFSRQRFSAWLLAGFAIVALVLAAVGIYGLLAYSVTVRTPEFGLRAALGAEPAQITGLVLKSGIWPVAGGLVSGMAAALVSSGLLKNLLFGIGPRDAVTFFSVPVLLAAIALLSAYLPARRAAGLDPMSALRTE
jgi:putative ABC transport system permease protein